MRRRLLGAAWLLLWSTAVLRADPSADLKALVAKASAATPPLPASRSRELVGQAREHLQALLRQQPAAALPGARNLEQLGTVLIHRHGREGDANALWEMARGVYEEYGGPVGKLRARALAEKLDDARKRSPGGIQDEDDGEGGVTRSVGLLALALVALAGIFVSRSRRSAPTGLALVDADALKSAQTSLELGLRLLRQGRADQAVRALERVVKVDAGLRAKGSYYLGVAALAGGQRERAQLLLREVEPTQVGSEEVYGLAEEMERRGDSGLATELFRRLYLADASYRDVKQRLAVLDEQEAGGAEQAIARMVASRAFDERFWQLELLGFGGMGLVFRASDGGRGDQVVALKALSPFYANHPEVRQRFLREAELIQELEHPNLIRVFDVFDSKLPYYSMEYLEGGSLADLLASEGRLEGPRVEALARQFCAGLGAAHARGVVHRDVKPDNIMVVGDSIKLIDFGVARLLDATAMTMTGQVLGTPLYMAPEQVRGVEDVDIRADIYAFGVVMYRALTGGLPFETAGERVLGPVPELPADLEVSPELRLAVTRCLQKAPEDRYPDLASLANELPG